MVEIRCSLWGVLKISSGEEHYQRIVLNLDPEVMTNESQWLLCCQGWWKKQRLENLVEKEWNTGGLYTVAELPFRSHWTISESGNNAVLCHAVHAKPHAICLNSCLIFSCWNNHSPMCSAVLGTTYLVRKEPTWRHMCHWNSVSSKGKASKFTTGWCMYRDFCFKRIMKSNMTIYVIGPCEQQPYRLSCVFVFEICRIFKFRRWWWCGP